MTKTEAALREALERVMANYERTLARKPVLDVDETFAECRTALAQPTEPPPSADGDARDAWISVKDRLPAVEEQVLTVCVFDRQRDWPHRFIAWISHETDDWMSSDFLGVDHVEVTHWAKLPQLPAMQERDHHG